MGLLDDIFGKEAIRKQLSDKDDEITRAVAKISEQENELPRLRDALSEGNERIASLSEALQEKTLENSRLKSQLEEFGRVSLEKAAQTAGALSAMDESLAVFNLEVVAAKKERDALAKELQAKRVTYEENDRLQQERESRFSDESEMLSRARQKLQQQVVELRAREAEVAERDQLFADLKSDLDSKSVQLSRQKTEQEARTRKLEDWARELFAFRNRVDRLDGEVEKLEIRKKEIESKEKDYQSQRSAQLAELQLQRSELGQRKNELKRGELNLKAREESVKRGEVQLLQARNRSIELEKERKRLVKLVESLEDARSQALSEVPAK